MADCPTLYGMAMPASDFITGAPSASYASAVLDANGKDVTLGPEQLEMYKSWATTPVVSSDFTQTFPRQRYDCHSANVNTAQLVTDIAMLNDMRGRLLPKLRDFSIYTRSQEVYLAELRAKAEFASAARGARRAPTDPITRGSAILVQQPLDDSMTWGLATTAAAMGILAVVSGAGFYLSKRH